MTTFESLGQVEKFHDDGCRGVGSNVKKHTLR